MDSSLFALNPSLNNNLGSSLKDLGNTIWRVGCPRPTMPYPKQQTQTHIFIDLCGVLAGYAMATAFGG